MEGPELTQRSEQASPAPVPSRIARLPIHFFAVAVVFFALGVTAAPFVVGDIVGFFYQPRVLALVHTFTLGWITAVIMGVMYRYIPALTRRPVMFPRVAVLQLWLFVVGVIGLIAHFANGVWVGTWFSAGVVVASVALFAANLIPCLAPQFGRGVAETGMLLAVFFLLAAGTLGFLMALDKTFGFLGGSLLTNLGAHAHLAAVGWVTLTICAASYRFIPAFLLPKVQLPAVVIWQLYGLAFGVVALGITLLARLGGATLWGGVIALSLVSYVVTMGRLVRSRRMPIDWTVRHALTAIAWLLIACLMGLILALFGAGSMLGNRLAGAYGVLGLFGWITNFIVGMSYQLFPGFVAGARAIVGWPVPTIAELSIPSCRAFVFFSLNLGIAILSGSLLLGLVVPAILGASVVTAGGLTYSVVTAWTLSYGYRSSMPADAKTALRIMPD